jgi:hypothetical protein
VDGSCCINRTYFCSHNFISATEKFSSPPVQFIMNNITINRKHQKQIDTADLSWCKMALLKKQDAFMYYSIPGNRDTREIQGKDLNLSDAKISACPGTRRRSILVVEKEGATTKIASRRTSFTALC